MLVEQTAEKRLQPRRIVIPVIWAAALLVICPVVFHWTAPEQSMAATRIARVLAFFVGLLLCWLFYRAEIRRMPKQYAASVVLLVAVLSLVSCYLHHIVVDLGYYFPGIPNYQTQQALQNKVVQLSPDVLPHSYRFLPNALVYWMQMLRVRFSTASEIYRLLGAVVLFYTLYRYARLYTSHVGGLLAMVLAGLVYPISFIEYAGQLTDPLSHLSFLFAFIFLETEDFPLFLTTLLIGSLAKETVLAMMGFYLLFCFRQKNYARNAVVLCITCIAAYVGVRMFVLHGAMGYHDVSGVGLQHLGNNIRRTSWIPHVGLTAGAYLPFLFLAWRDTPSILKKLSLYLLPVLFISSWFFSWLCEGRNFMPLVFVLAVVAGRYLAKQLSSPTIALDTV